jgi:hypothetical protein
MMNPDKKRSPLKDKPLRMPGQSLDNEIDRIQRNIFVYIGLASILITLAFYEWWHWYRNLPPQPIAAIVVATAIVIYSYLKVRHLRKQLSNLRLGRDGERMVGQALDELRQHGYAIFHDVVGTGFNVDHVVVSPHGVFAVETKTYSKPASVNATVVFDGEKVTLAGYQPDPKPIQQAIANADWLRREVLLASTGKLFPVKPVVVFPGWWVAETSKNEHIWVLNPKMLSTRISQEPQSLTQADVHLVVFHLSRFVRMSS